MYLRQLRVVNFRNHARTELTLGTGVHVFLGANAQGKSNLLEAVGVAAIGRSQRTGRDADLIRFGEAWARVRAAVCRQDRTTEIDVGLRADGSEAAPARIWKEVRVNGVPGRRGDLFGHLVVVAVSPEDTELIAGRPVMRRMMLDLLLAQESPSYYFLAARYARVLLHRNRALRSSGPRHLEGWDEQVVALGAAITARRRDLVRRLVESAGPSYRALSGGTEALTIHYHSALPGEDETAMIGEGLTALAARRVEECARGMTLVGPHRDELQVCVDGRELRLYGSRGQQQTAGLALRLAARQILCDATGEEPVLLLDDVLLALDEERQAYVFDQVRRGQTLITLTTLAAAHTIPRDAAVYRVAGGSVEGPHAYRP